MLIDVQIELADWFSPVEKHLVKINKATITKSQGIAQVPLLLTFIIIYLFIYLFTVGKQCFTQLQTAN